MKRELLLASALLAPQTAQAADAARDMEVRTTQLEGISSVMADVTEQRRYILASTDFDEACDQTLLFFPGFTWQSTAATGGLLDAFEEAAEFQRPGTVSCFLALEDSGKGTLEYEANKEKLAQYGFKDYLEDVEVMLRYAEKRWPAFFAGDLVLHGYSLGAFGAMEVADEMIYDDEKTIHALILDSPASNKPFAALNPAFLDTVMGQVPRAFAQTVSGKGAVTLNEKQNAHLFGVGAYESALSVPDSGKRFFGWGMHSKPFYPTLPREFASRGIPVELVQHLEDTLIPEGSFRSYERWFGKEGNVVNRHLVPDMAHGIPYQMTPMQVDAYQTAFEAVLAPHADPTAEKPATE